MIHFHNELCYPLESAMLIARIYADDSPGRWLRENVSNWVGYEDKLRAMYRPLDEVYQEVAQAIGTDDEVIRYLVEDFDVADVAAVPTFLFPEKRPADERAKLAAFADAFTQEGGLVLESRDALMAHLEAEHTPLKERAKILLAYEQYDFFADRFYAVRNAVEEMLRARRTSLAPLVEEKIDDIRRAIETLGLDGLMRQMELPVTLGEEDDLELYPHLFAPNAIEIVNNRLLWGLFVMDLVRMRQGRKFSSERLHDVLKVLADGTKFEMLRLLSREELYGGELAERLSLSPATISHHISQLTSLHLIRIVKQGGRLYYRTEPEMLGAYLRAAERTLLRPDEEDKTDAKA